MSMGKKIYSQCENVLLKLKITNNIIYLVNTSTDSTSDHVWCFEGLQIEWRQEHSLSSKNDIVETVYIGFEVS